VQRLLQLYRLCLQFGLPPVGVKVIFALTFALPVMFSLRLILPLGLTRRLTMPLPLTARETAARAGSWKRTPRP
jgi:hypothetical protein